MVYSTNTVSQKRVKIVFLKLNKKQLHWKRLLHEFLLIFYIVLVLFIALFSREPGSRDALALVPLSTWGITPQAHAYVIENVLLFIPFGFLLPFVWEKMRSFPFCLFVTFLASMAIEITQVITRMGFGQTDDVIMNVIGGGIGLIVYRVWKHTYTL